MKVIFFTTVIASALLFGCKTGENLSKQEIVKQITEKVESQNYTFVPQTAIPMGGRSININYSYSLKISQDTIDSYLPYFGRAYTAPSPMDEGGIKFVSTDFEYLKSDKNNGMWDVKIDVKNNQRLYNLNLKIGDTGSATLTVSETSRQPITFYGKIE